MIALVRAKPNGTTTGMAHLHVKDGPHRWEEVTRDTYDDSDGRPLRMARIHAGMMLDEAAAMVGVSRVDFSYLEQGRYLLSADDWRTVWQTLFGIEPRTMADLCPTCGGSGESQLSLYTGRGAHFESNPCGACNGSGLKAAPAAGGSDA